MKPITKSELDQVLQEHQLWLESDCVKGARAYLRGADLRGSDMRGAKLQGAHMWGADLRRADMRGARLQGADLWGADLRGADLQSAHLQSADLREAQFDVNIRHCRSFEGAALSTDALPWLILHPKWSEWKDAVRIEETVA